MAGDCFQQFGHIFLKNYSFSLYVTEYDLSPLYGLILNGYLTRVDWLRP